MTPGRRMARAGSAPVLACELAGGAIPPVFPLAVLHLSHRAPRCHTSAGLTNQENQVGNCIRIAAALDRVLLPPRPRIFLEKSAVVPILDDGNGGALPFQHLWDKDHLRDCALQKYGVRLLENVSSVAELPQPAGLTMSLMWSRGDPNVNWTFTRLAQRSRRGHDSQGARTPVVLSELSVAKPAAGMSVPEAAADAARAVLRAHVPKWISTVVAREPFFALSSHMTPEQTCARPAPAVQARIEAIRASLGSYACLHARLEEDWFNYCCVRGSLQRGKVTAASEMEMKRNLNLHSSTYSAWVHNGATGVPPLCGALQAGRKVHAPPRQCYASAQQIAEVMLRAPGLGRGSTVFVASGASEVMLAPIAASFKIARRPQPVGGSVLLSYEDALVDRGVCERATLGFFGHELSTFSMLLHQMRSDRSATIWYNREPAR